MGFRRAVLALSILLLACGSVRADDDFRIETRVSNGDEGLITRVTTLFQGREVFDYMERTDEKSKGESGSENSQGEVTIFQPDLERFVIVFPPGKIYTSIRFEEIEKGLEKKRAALRRDAKRLANSTDARARAGAANLAFLADPEFTEQYNDQNGVLLLSSSLITYRARTIDPRRRRAVDRIRELTDWQAKLNHLLNGSMPPYPRLALDASLAKWGRIAKEIHLTIATDGAPLQVRAEHVLDPSLSREDVNRIEATRRQLKEFTAVSFLEYIRRRTNAAQTAAKERTRR